MRLATTDTARPAGLDDGPAIDALRAAAYVIPTDQPESDGTLAWDSTTLVVVDVRAGDARGMGYTYADRAAAELASRLLAPIVEGARAFAIPEINAAMWRAVRNIGREGIAATAISAVDIALWDLTARLVDRPLIDVLGSARDSVPAYGSGGFTSYTNDELARQLGGWAAAGFERVKMKVGRAPGDDPGRVRAAREAVGPDVELFVDANGAFHRADARLAAARFAREDVRWFEEPVSSDDVAGLRLVRDTAPPGMAIAAGEYGWSLFHFRGLLEAGAVDVLQADATRCGGVSGYLAAAALAAAHNVPLSSHCAPALHTTLGCATTSTVHLEWFHDHARIERALFVGAPQPVAGRLAPDRSRPGLGLELQQAVANEYLEWRSW